MPNPTSDRSVDHRVAQSTTLASSQLITDVRSFWLNHEKLDRPTCVALAVLHGHLERLLPLQQADPKVLEFSKHQFAKIKMGSASAIEIETGAGRLGLSMCSDEPV